MNGKLPANCFTCSQGYLRPNILYCQRDPQIQQSQSQAKPTLPLYIIPGESISSCISGLGCTDSSSTQKGLPKDALKQKPEEQPFVITKYDWHTSALVFSEKPSLFDQDRALAVLNGEKLYIEEAADSNENPPDEANNVEEIKIKIF